MRIPALAMIAAATIVTAVPAQAQTYSPDYPVCLHVYGRTNSIECSYTSIPQCQASAQGRSAQCEVNPFLALDEPGVPVQGRHHRRGHRTRT
jgi:hypothetical protein